MRMRATIGCAVLCCMAFFAGNCNRGSRGGSETADKKPAADPDVSGPGTLAHFHRILDLRSDVDYADILAELKHAQDRIVPPDLRTLVVETDPARLHMTSAVHWTDGELRYVWFLSEIAFRGDARESVEHIDDILVPLGFSVDDPVQNKYGYTVHTWTKQDGLVHHHFWLEGPEDYYGGNDPMCGGTAAWESTYAEKVEQPTAAEVLEVWPELDCTDLPTEIHAALEDEQITSMDHGGTWVDRYDWAVTTSHPDADAAKEKMAETIELIESLGFETFATESDNLIWTRRVDGVSSFVYLSIEEETGFRFRYQPRA